LNAILRIGYFYFLTMLFLPTSTALNHLLAQNSWALRRLAHFAGKAVRFDITPFSLAYTILADGSVLATGVSASADTTCTIAPSLLPRLALRDEAAYAEIRHEGDSALFAEIVALMRELRWDMAEDLSHVTGDIVAERIAQTVQGAQHQLRDAATNLSQAAAEYLTEERPLLAKPQHIAELKRLVESLRDDAARLEQRIKTLSPTPSPASVSVREER
jgi:ubiquinone biosynthesis accessory factor UbiJ